MGQPYGAAVIGMGHGKSHAQAYRDNPATELIAVCDKYIDKARAAADQFGAAVATNDYREVLADKRVDVVSVVTPDKLHVEHAVAALQAGKHVLCEKPLALTVEGCTALVEAARAAQTVFMVGQSCRFSPGFVEAHRLVENGAIGDLFFVESEYAHHYEDAKGVDEWRLDPDRYPVIGGGCHAVDFLRWVAGDPVEAMAYANHNALPDWPYDDATVAILKFPGNVIGKVFVSIGCRRPYTMRSAFYGTTGTIICDNTSPFIRLHRHGIEPHERFSEIAVEVNHHNVPAEVEMITDLICSDQPVALTAVEGGRTVAACVAIVESARTGKPVAINYPW